MKFAIADTGENGTFGKYKLVARIGNGGMAEVFIAVANGPAGFNKLVVIKRLLPKIAADVSYRSMFVHEARLAARLNHPNVVQTYEVGEHQGIIYMAMEYLEGQPLSRVRRALANAGRRLRPSTCMRIAADVLGGLHHAHELRDFDGSPLRVVHRDVSPQNVFVTYAGQVKVLDFGIAKAERSGSETQAGIVKGKYAYMAPEQFADGPIDHRVDVFTAGIVLWELVAGRSLFAGGQDAQVVRRLVHDPIPRLSTVVPGVDPVLDDIVARALERDPDQRTPTALAMKEELEQRLAALRAPVEDVGLVVASAFVDVRRAIDDLLSNHLGRLTLANDDAIDELVSVATIKTSDSTIRSGTHRRARSEDNARLGPSRPRTSRAARRSAMAGTLVVVGLAALAGMGLRDRSRAAEAPAPTATASALEPLAIATTAVVENTALPEPSPAAPQPAPTTHASSRASHVPGRPNVVTPARSTSQPASAAPKGASTASAAPSPSSVPPEAPVGAASGKPPAEGRRFRTTF